MLPMAVLDWLKCIRYVGLPLVLISLYPDEWRDFHDCSKDVLQYLSEGDQEASCHVSAYPPWLKYFFHFQEVIFWHCSFPALEGGKFCFILGFRGYCMTMVWWYGDGITF